MNKLQEEREAFEAWWHSEYISTEQLIYDESDNTYLDFDHNAQWEAWQAARAPLLAEIERLKGELSDIRDNCDHDWEFKDDSFDHEFGTEKIHYEQCSVCNLTQECTAADFDPCDGSDNTM